MTTFVIDPMVCQRLRPTIPADRLAVAESGIQSQEDVTRLADAGYDAVLVGRALIEAADPARRLEQLTRGVLTQRGTQK